MRAGGARDGGSKRDGVAGAQDAPRNFPFFILHFPLKSEETK